MSKEKLVKILGFVVDGFWFVRWFYICFFMLLGCVDIIWWYKKLVIVFLMDDDNGEDMGYRVFEYVDKEKSWILFVVLF